MNTDTKEARPYGFAAGMATGAVVGVGVAMWLAPRFTAELRARLGRSAASVQDTVTDRCEQVSAAVGGAVADITRKSRSARNDVADAVAHGAREVERYAEAAKTS